MTTTKLARDLARRAFLTDLGPYDAPTGLSLMKGASRVVRFERGRDQGFIGDAVCTIGAFDGIHRAHRFLFATTVGDALRRRAKSVIVTFDPDPDELFCPRSGVRKLLNNEDRVGLLSRFGADVVFVVPFTRALAALDPEHFLTEVLGSYMNPVAVHVGSNFRLGAGNSGTVEVLREIGAHRGFDVFGHSLQCAEAAPVSATRIRNLVGEGKVEEATRLLGRPHFLRGHVIPGRHEGTSFGFPTANVRVDYPYVMPAEGVYAGFVAVGDTAWPAAINVGIPRTFAAEEGCSYLEPHLLGFSGDIYDTDVRVAFTHFLRPQHAFASTDELIATVMHNIDQTRELFGDEGVAL